MEALYIAIGSYMLFGLLLFEYCYAQVKSFRTVDEERDSKFPAYRRYDAIYWARWKFWPGAMTLMPIRLAMAVLIVILNYILVK